MQQVRSLTPLDRLLAGVERALETVAGTPVARRPSPAAGLAGGSPGCGRAAPCGRADADQPHRRGMRPGAVQRPGGAGARARKPEATCCTLPPRKPTTWPGAPNACANWTAGPACSIRCGTSAATPSARRLPAVSDPVSLGFVVETERQVEAHLAEHLQRLPATDGRSRAVLEQMQADEIRHADNARARGGIELPFPIPGLMRLSSLVMKTVAYRI